MATAKRKQSAFVGMCVNTLLDAREVLRALPDQEIARLVQATKFFQDRLNVEVENRRASKAALAHHDQ
jgi:hypothetical protein